MRVRQFLFPSSIILLALGGCSPFEGFEGEYNAGPVDPVNFPAEYLGGANRLQPGTGRFVANQAFVDGPNSIEYFLFTLPGLAPTATSATVARSAAATTYVFDPNPPSPFPSAPRCQPPSPNYTFSYSDVQGDGVNYGEQWNIFTALPVATYNPGQASTTNYRPIVAETSVTTGNLPCQSIKTEKTLKKSSNVTVGGQPTGRYLAWAIIDPEEPVYHADGQTPGPLGGPGLPAGVPYGGVGLQKWGWFNHYILAYIDGGYVTATVAAPNLVLATQRLYIPTNVRTSPTAAPGAGAVGAGYDVLQFRRGQTGYQPVCEVRVYNTPGGALTPVASALPKTEADVRTTHLANGGVGDPPQATGTIPRYIFCLQIQ